MSGSKFAQPEAKHSGKYYCPLTEKNLFNPQRIKDYLHQKEWFRKVAQNHTISLGGEVYYLPKAKPNKEVKIIFDKKDDTLIFYDVKELIAQLPLKGIQFEALVEPQFLTTLKNLQFEFPFDWLNAKINTTF